MEQSVLHNTLFAISIFLSTSLPLSSPSGTIIEKPAFIQEYNYVVKEGDSISLIAEKEYGSPAYWTIIWNDNSFIQDPNIIAEGLVLKMRTQKPIEIESLDEKLAVKMDNSGVNNEEKSLVVNQSEHTVNVTPPVSMPTTVVEPAESIQTASYTNGTLTHEQLTYLGNCEAGMDPTKNTGNGYYGAFQFSYATWKSMGTAYERADLAPLDVQKDAVQRLLSRSSIYTQFPGCARAMQKIGMI
jgi:hypothetical protein